ncbi:MAG: Uncharacterised protein [Polaribacter sp. SA4-10]|nr:MAG: Uncharacterised protein [Polaribacter sp. SA4-10]
MSACVYESVFGELQLFNLVKLSPPSVEDQIFKTPTYTLLTSLSETVKARSYHACVLSNISSVSAVCRNESPEFVDFQTPLKALPLPALTKYT